jgi:hypothetical protein
MSLPVYDVVLLPPVRINDLSIATSVRLGEAIEAEFALSDSIYPHISLYMANLTPENLEKAKSQLKEAAMQSSALSLEGQRFVTSPEGMCEIFYQKPPELIALQEKVVDTLNPLRTGMREFDPVGRKLAEYIQVAPKEARDNLQQYGYDEIGSFFNPHITLTRFKQRDSSPETTGFHFPAPQDFNALYTTLALCEMGDHGTCVKVIDTWELRQQ